MEAGPLDALDDHLGGVSMRRIATLTLLLAVLAASAAFAASDQDQVTARFTIPSWIALSIVGSADVDFGEIAGGGAYVGDTQTTLRVLSTTSWTLTNTILWSDPATSIPAGASQTIIEAALDLTLSDTSGAWGLHLVTVDYQMTVTDEDLAELPVGDYSVVIQYTASTD